MTKKILLGVGALIVLVLGVVGYFVGPALYDFWKGGFFEKAQKRQYNASNMDNLKSLHTALMQYHESEGMFPYGNGWMDAIEPQIRVGDMKKAESDKKLVHPMFWPPNGREFGYAFNDLCGGKYRDDIKDPDKTPLVFDSKDLSRNAHGDPKSLLPDPLREGGNLGISVSGKILRL